VKQEKDLKELRKAIEDVSTSIGRVLLIRLGLVFLFAITLSHAFAILSSNEDQIDALRKGIKESENVTGAFHWVGDPLHNPLSSSEPNFDEPKQQPQPVYAVVTEAARQSSVSEFRKLQSIYQSAFAQHLSIWGADLDFDLRYAIYALPLGLVTSQGYLFLLARKRKLLSVIGVRRSSKSYSPAEGSLTRLFFVGTGGRLGAFGLWPSRGVEHIYSLLTLGAFAYFAVASFPFWGDWLDSGSFSSDVIPVAFIVFICYFTFFCRHIAGRMSDDAASAAGIDVSEDLARRMGKWLLRRGQSLAHRVRPRVSLSIGSVCLIATLLMSTGLSSCGDPEPGYNLIRNKSHALSAYVVGDGPAHMFCERYAQFVGVWTYRFAILFAILTLVALVPATLRRKRCVVENACGRSLVCLAAIWLVAILLGDFSLGFLAAADWPPLIFVIHVLGIVGGIVWSANLPLGKTPHMRQWSKATKIFLVICFPAFLSDLLMVLLISVFSIGAESHAGLLVYLLGAGLLAHGYIANLRLCFAPATDGRGSILEAVAPRT
jgi:hypothetical protein